MRSLARLLVICAAVFMFGCDEKLSDVTGPTQNLTPTFSSIQHDIFEQPDSAGRVACTQCHNPTGFGFRVGGLDLTSGVSYNSLVNVASRQKPGVLRVKPGDPDNSYLIHKIEGGPDIVGLRMPFSGAPFLTNGQILVLRRWIELGARND
jgi:hypothetical protein